MHYASNIQRQNYSQLRATLQQAGVDTRFVRSASYIGQNGLCEFVIDDEYAPTFRQLISRVGVHMLPPDYDYLELRHHQAVPNVVRRRVEDMQRRIRSVLQTCQDAPTRECLTAFMQSKWQQAQTAIHAAIWGPSARPLSPLPSSSL